MSTCGVIEQRTLTMLAAMALLGLTSCNTSKGFVPASRLGEIQSLSDDSGADGTVSPIDPPGDVVGVDIAATVVITELLPPQYTTINGLRPPGPVNTKEHLRYQVALASVQHQYLPSNVTLLAFIVNFSVDGVDDEILKNRAIGVEVGDTGAVYGKLAAGSRWYGSTGLDYYAPTPPFPIGPNTYSDLFLRDTVLNLRDSNLAYESIVVVNWCEFANGMAVNYKTGWSVTIPEFEAEMTKALARPRWQTPVTKP